MKADMIGKKEVRVRKVKWNLASPDLVVSNLCCSAERAPSQAKKRHHIVKEIPAPQAIATAA